LVFNKEDKVDSRFIRQCCQRYGAISISALKGKNLNNLLSRIEKILWKDMDPIIDPGIGRSKSQVDKRRML